MLKDLWQKIRAFEFFDLGEWREALVQIAHGFTFPGLHPAFYCEFIVPSEPCGKGRPRFSRGGHAYTPEKTARAENLVMLTATEAMRGRLPTERPVRVEIEAFFTMPRSMSIRKRTSMAEAPCMKKPDMDNIAKLVLDAMNGVVYADDSQVVCMELVKRWSIIPGTRVRVSEFQATEEEP
jgi:Holliday junction resolvase RusA-like endonuclease